MTNKKTPCNRKPRELESVGFSFHHSVQLIKGGGAVASFKFTKLRSGVYKVVPHAPLEPGEYCFLSAAGIGGFGAGAASASRLFDFGIIPTAQ